MIAAIQEGQWVCLHFAHDPRIQGVVDSVAEGTIWLADGDGEVFAVERIAARVTHAHGANEECSVARLPTTHLTQEEMSVGYIDEAIIDEAIKEFSEQQLAAAREMMKPSKKGPNAGRWQACSQSRSSKRKPSKLIVRPNDDP